jgi:hypothetical protein
LQDGVKIGQGAIGSHEKAPPEHRVNPANPNVDYVNFRLRILFHYAAQPIRWTTPRLFLAPSLKCSPCLNGKQWNRLKDKEGIHRTFCPFAGNPFAILPEPFANRIWLDAVDRAGVYACDPNCCFREAVELCAKATSDYLHRRRSSRNQ